MRYHTVRTFWGMLVSAHRHLFRVKQKFHLVCACNYFTSGFWYCLSRQAVLTVEHIENPILIMYYK